MTFEKSNKGIENIVDRTYIIVELGISVSVLILFAFVYKRMVLQVW